MKSDMRGHNSVKYAITYAQMYTDYFHLCCMYMVYVLINLFYFFAFQRFLKFSWNLMHQHWSALIIVIQFVRKCASCINRMKGFHHVEFYICGKKTIFKGDFFYQADLKTKKLNSYAGNSSNYTIYINVLQKRNSILKKAIASWHFGVIFIVLKKKFASS